MRLVRTQIFLGVVVVPLRNGEVEPCYRFYAVCHFIFLTVLIILGVCMYNFVYKVNYG